MKKVAIIGAGFTGLAAALRLSENEEIEVTIFEKEKQPGGLAGGFKTENWKNSLEFHYHHFFTNDYFGINLMKKVGVNFQKLSPITSILSRGKMYKFDSPISLLRFPLLTSVQKMRIAFFLFLFKLFPQSKFNPLLPILKKQTSYNLIPKLIGEKSFNLLFKPLFEQKFGEYANKIAAIWFWARINKRTTKLIYPEGGYQFFADKLLKYVRQHGVRVELNSKITEIKNERNKWLIKTANGEEIFDAVLLTAPFPVAQKMISVFPFPQIPHLDSLNLILETKKPILKKEYWLNINDTGFPFLALIQHTNFCDKKDYGENHISYVGNYLPKIHEFFQKSKEELIDKFLPKLQTINPGFQKNDIINSFLFRGVDAQPVVDIEYEKKIPPIDLSKISKNFEGLFIANMDMVFPWDRGVNYAIELGERAADIISKT